MRLGRGTMIVSQWNDPPGGPRLDRPASARRIAAMPRQRYPLAFSVACALGVALGCNESPRGPAHVATADAGRRVREIFAIEDPLVRVSELAALLAKLEPDALPAVRDAYGEAPLDRGDTEVVLLATWWARF